MVTLVLERDFVQSQREEDDAPLHSVLTKGPTTGMGGIAD